jgi:Tfp pilus assembly protein PilZ
VEIEDMAAGGVALKTAEPLPDGSRVTLVLEPGDGSGEIEISGQVVWNRQDDDTTEVGIEFEKSGGESMRRLRQMIRGVKVSGETLE